MDHPPNHLHVQASSPLPSPYSFSDLPHSLGSSEEGHSVQPAAPSSTYTQSSFLGCPDSRTFSTSNNESQGLSGDGDIIDTSSFFRHRSYSMSHKAGQSCHHSHGTSEESCRHGSWRRGDLSLLTSLSSPNVGYWRQSAAFPIASCSQPVLLSSTKKEQPNVEVLELIPARQRRPSTFRGKSGKPRSALPLRERSLTEKAFKESSRRDSLLVARSPNTPLTSTFQTRHTTNFVSISRKFQGDSTSESNITGSFLIDPRIRIPAGILRTFDSDISLHKRGSHPSNLVGLEGTKMHGRKPNLFLGMKNGFIDVGIELVPSSALPASGDLSDEVTVLELKVERPSRSFKSRNAKHAENAEIAVRITAPHPRPAFHLDIDLQIELMTLIPPLLSAPSQLEGSPKSRKKLLQRHRPREEHDTSSKLPANPESSVAQTFPNVKEADGQFSPIRVLIPRTYHGPVTITTTTDFAPSSHFPHPSAAVYLSNLLQETAVLMSETTKTHGDGGQKQKTGYFVHAYTLNRDAEPNPRVSQLSTSDNSEHGGDEQWIFVTPSLPTHQRCSSYIPQPQVIGEKRNRRGEDPYCEWFGDKIDIRVEFTCPPTANGAAQRSLQNGVPDIVQPEVWLGYSDEEQPFTDRFDHLVDGCIIPNCVSTQEGSDWENAETCSKEGRSFLRWLTFGCFP